MNIKLVLDNLGVLSLSKDVAVPLTYNLNDIRDISTRGGVWSKTVQIYGTNENNAVLGPIFDVNADTLAFNPRRKEPCTIVSDGMVIFEGVFQITKINNRLVDGNWRLVYDCYLKSDTSNFYTVISGKFLTDIDLTEFNHIATFDTVTDSLRNGNWLDGYQYFVAYNETVDWLGEELNLFEIQDFRPAVYAKIYWDKIFQNAGYTYRFDEQTALNFDKLIIPFNGETIQPYISNEFRFRIGINGGTTTSTIMDIPVYPPAFNPTINEVTVPFRDNDEVTENWFDNSGAFNTTSYRWEIPTNCPDSIQFEAIFAAQPLITITAGGFGVGDLVAVLKPLPFYDNPDDIFEFVVNYHAKIAVYDIFGAEISILADQLINSAVFISGADAYGGTPYPVNEPFAPLDASGITLTLNTSLTGLLFLPDVPAASFVKVVTYVTYEMYISDDGGDRVPITTPNWRGFAVVGTNTYLPSVLDLSFLDQSDAVGHFTNNVLDEIVYNANISMNSAIPKKIKQTDFIAGIVKMFNLYIKENPANITELIVKTRDKFYEDGVDLDWSNKVDVQSIDIELLSNSQIKQKLFSYKDDSKDQVLQAYTKQTNEIFGQVDYIFNNDFIKGESKVDPIFSPTIVVQNYNKTVPFIAARAPKNNIRILSVGDYIEQNYPLWHQRVVIQGVVISTTPEYGYRHVGHFYPNSQTPEQDINFGICDFYAHQQNTITNNNLYNRFYWTQYDIFENGYMLTADFNLTYSDFSQLTLAERIYCNNSWWNINKISDFDPTKNKLTKVELISADPFFSGFIPNNNVFSSGSNSFAGAINQQFRLDNPSNVLGRSSGIDIKGSYNFVQDNSKSVDIIGDFNSVSGSNILNVGNNNKIYGNNIQVLGISNGNFTEPNTITLGRTIIYSDVINAGRDEVLNHFPDAKIINFIDAGRDEVRPLGSFSIENIISGGRYTN